MGLEHDSNPTILGMINKVKHLVSVERKLNNTVMNLSNLQPAEGSTHSQK
jgi:hypothetical protein